MVFSSLYFLYFFFPVAFVLYLLVPKNTKNLVLLLASIYFYAWGEPVYIVLMLFSAVFNYVMGLDIDRRKDFAQRKQSMLFGILVNLLILGFFKYYDVVVKRFCNIYG